MKKNEKMLLMVDGEGRSGGSFITCLHSSSKHTDKGMCDLAQQPRALSISIYIVINQVSIKAYSFSANIESKNSFLFVSALTGRRESWMGTDWWDLGGCRCL